MADKTIFVTVGTTQFDDLIRAVTESQVLKLIKKIGFNRLLLQNGNGAFEPVKNSIQGLTIDTFRLKDSIEKEILESDMVISHAGAGSCLEVLELGKPLIVVINKSLMGNHQAELADALQSRNYAAACTVETLCQTLADFNPSKLVQYPKADSSVFNEYLNNLMGMPQT